MGQSYTCLHYHLIFSTKHREPSITPDMQPRLYQYIGGLLRGEKGCLLAAGGMPDHVHLLCGIHKEMAVSEALRVIKAGSSRWIHETFPERPDFAWQAGYGAFTVSRSNMDTVTHYLARQEEHHRKRTFKEEFVEFLKRHEIPYEERYLWD